MSLIKATLTFKNNLLDLSLERSLIGTQGDADVSIEFIKPSGYENNDLTLYIVASAGLPWQDIKFGPIPVGTQTTWDFPEYITTIGNILLLQVSVDGPKGAVFSNVVTATLRLMSKGYTPYITPPLDVANLAMCSAKLEQGFLNFYNVAGVKIASIPASGLGGGGGLDIHKAMTEAELLVQEDPTNPGFYPSLADEFIVVTDYASEQNPPSGGGGGGGGSGSGSHPDLTERDDPNQHPISAITGLEQELLNSVNNIINVQRELGTEVAERQADVSNLQSDLAAEKTIRKTEDDKLQTSIDSLFINTATESATRQAEDDKLQGAIDAEVTARIAAESAIDTRIQNEALIREQADISLSKRIETQEGLGGYLNSYDFGKDDPTQDELNDYAKLDIWGADADQHDKSEIFHNTHLVNLFDNATWVLANTPTTVPPIFVWSKAYTNTNVATATNADLGLVKGDSTTPGRVRVIDADGHMEANGLALHLVDTDVHVTTAEKASWDAKADVSATGQIVVADPVNDDDAANKGYVDAIKVNGVAAVSQDIKNVFELTQVEFDAQNAAGTLIPGARYLVEVPEGGKQGFAYSYDEKWTGDYWIDGKKIYQKTINFGALPNTTTKTLEINTVNVAQYVSVTGIAMYDKGCLPLPASGNALTELVSLNINTSTGSLSCWTGRDRSMFTAYIALQYTCTDR